MCEFEKDFAIEDFKEDEAPDMKFAKRTDIETKSRIFTTLLPLFGEVSKCFYIPECDQRASLAKLIEEHGGAMSPYAESLWQIVPDGANALLE